MKKPTLRQRMEWHPAAETPEVALSRMRTLCIRLRSKGAEYDADIAEMEVLPFLKSIQPKP